MEDRRLNKVIGWVRNIQEQMGGGAVGGGMTTQSTATKAGFGGSAQGGDSGPTAGFDPKLGKMQRRKKIIGLGAGSRKRWM